MKRNSLHTAAAILALLLLWLLLPGCSQSSKDKSTLSPQPLTAAAQAAHKQAQASVAQDGSVGAGQSLSNAAAQPISPPSPSATPTPAPSETPVQQEPALLAVALPQTEQPIQPTPTPAPSVAPKKTRPSAAVVYSPASPGTTSYSGGGVSLDASNIAEGYVTVKYSGQNHKVKLQITKDSGTTYTYDITKRGSYEVFPLTEGNGSYTVNIFENIGGTSYAQAMGQKITVTLRSGLLPFLYPNQFVNFNANSQAVKKGEQLAEGASDDLAVVSAVYNYVIKNISYDTATAEGITAGRITSYLPSVDTTLSSGSGICFDYAALMTAMLRSQNIPTRLEVGYAGSIYHAWLSTYITDVGWVNGVIYFDGKNWKLMDPTFASSANSSTDIMRFIGNGSNYTRKFVY